MPAKKEEDLFKDTTMTFGEHLEELRSCLFKSLLALVLGFLVGLLIGAQVVDFIQNPLEDALTEYYSKRSVDQIENQLGQLRDAGYVLPEDPAEIEKFIAEEGLKYEEVYFNPEELLRVLGKADPQRFGRAALEASDAAQNTDAAKPDRPNLVRVFLWRKIADGSWTKSLSPHEPFMIYIKASLLVGAILSSPLVFYQIWTFVGAGLYRYEKRYVHVFLPFSLGLFFLGASMAFFFVFGPVLRFLFMFNETLNIAPDMRINEWLGIVLVLPLGFGISFQLPLVMLFLERVGIFDVQVYLSKWRIAILVICVMAMFLTPADPTSMLLMAVPLTILYFGGILLCKWMPRSRSPYEELDE